MAPGISMGVLNAIWRLFGLDHNAEDKFTGPGRGSVDPVEALGIAGRLGQTEKVAEILSTGTRPPRARPYGDEDAVPEGFFAYGRQCDSLLHDAAEGGFTEIVRLLLDAGMSTEGDAKETPLFLACRFGKEEVALLLVERGARINVRCDPESGETPLSYACRGRPGLVRALIKAGADVNESICDVRGEIKRPIHMAACSMSLDGPEVIEVLIELGADISLKTGGETDRPQTALEAAKAMLSWQFDSQNWNGPNADYVANLERAIGTLSAHG